MAAADSPDSTRAIGEKNRAIFPLFIQYATIRFFMCDAKVMADAFHQWEFECKPTLLQETQKSMKGELNINSAKYRADN